jgi:glycosyltransferase involved in cell wall biosynthesis
MKFEQNSAILMMTMTTDASAKNTHAAGDALLPHQLRILQIVPTVEQEASGPSYAVPRLCAALSGAGNDLVLASVGGSWLTGDQPYVHYRAPRGFKGIPLLQDLWLSRGLRQHLMSEANWAEIIHSHGLWVMPNVYPALAARSAGKPLIVSPHGTLSSVALARTRRLKRIFWILLQRPAVRSAACLHATSEQEYKDIRRVGLRQPVAVVPIGVDIPPLRCARKEERFRTLLYLGRIHPIKGIDNLLRAWQGVATKFPDWQLRLVGPDDSGYLAQIIHVAEEPALPRVTFAGPRYGAEKQAEYAQADLCILPSHSENFGMSVAEALAQGIPVITTAGTPWQGVREHGCGWFVPATVPGIESALHEALACDRSCLADMGRAGRGWMERDFSWSRVAKDLEQTYRWILSGGSPPHFVRLN